MDAQYTQFFTEIFNEFVLLSSGLEKLIQYAKTLKGTQKENLTHIFLLKELAKEKVSSKIIDESAAQELIDEVSKKVTVLEPKKPKKITSFDDVQTMNNFTYDEEMMKCKFIYMNSIIYVDSIKDYTKNNKNIFSEAVDKPQMYQAQFNKVREFLLENPQFTDKFHSKGKNSFEIVPLGSLQGSSSDQEVTVFGMLLENESRKFQLQDSTNIIDVDISNVEKWGEGYFTSGCCVLCQGLFKNGVFKAKLIMHPPPVWNKRTFEEKYEKDFFGAIYKAFKKGSNDKETKKNKRHQHLDDQRKKPEANFMENFVSQDVNKYKILYPKTVSRPVNINECLNEVRASLYDAKVIESIFDKAKASLINEFFLVLSNTDLTDQRVLTAIEKIIVGYNPQPGNLIKQPFMIIFTGNFIPDQSYPSFKAINTAFDNLLSIILKNDNLVKNCYFVFLPGPEDFSLFNGFPKHPFIPEIIEKMKKKIPNIINATNPCRFSFFGKETVIYRNDLNKHLSRNAINVCEDQSNQKKYYCHTVLSQGSLSPLPLSIIPRIWHLGECMTMIPLPDILILGDVVEDFEESFEDLLVINPGNFSKDFSFTQIFPVKMTSQSCKVEL